MLFLLKRKASSTQIQAMLEEYGDMIKIAVDIRHNILAGGGEMHSNIHKMHLYRKECDDYGFHQLVNRKYSIILIRSSTLQI